jgi:hypothetical protein
MRYTVGSARVHVYGAAIDRAAPRRAVASDSAIGRRAQPRRLYVPAAGVQPSVSWWCLLRKGAGCVARCRTNIGCYATCAPEALECFR